LSFKNIYSIFSLSGLVKDIRTIDRQIKDLKGAVDMVRPQRQTARGRAAMMHETLHQLT
jgi:hypothetical protein